MISYITEELKLHYSNTFNKYGATPQGIDWGKSEENLSLRYKKMLDIVECKSKGTSLLDVGCGYGGLYEYIKNKDIKIRYKGIDIAENMISYAKEKFNSEDFILGDIFNYNFNEKYDFIVCNGILTQKLTASILDMEMYSQNLIKVMFDLCEKGIAFNIMTSRVNFMVNNLYYKSPVEMVSFCLSLTNKFKIDHSYPLYEYTVYLYK